MHILYLTGREIGYTRNDVLLRAFRRLGTVNIVAENGGGGILSRSINVFLRALPYLRSHRFDLVFVGFYGQLLMVPVGRLARPPILFDAFISTYDTLVEDRGQFSPASVPARIASYLDRQGCQRARKVLVDTPFHRDYFEQTFHIAPGKFEVLPVGCNEDIFYPRPRHRSGPFEILYYSTFLPLHGVDVVIRAAARLKGDSGLHFQIVGRGPEYERVRQLADDQKLQNIHFLLPVSRDRLADLIGESDIGIGGHFGASKKAGRVVPGKIYQLLAMEKPIIAGDTPANRSFLTDRETALLCPPGDPDSLADAINELARTPDLREKLALNGRTLYERQASELVITKRLEQIIQSALA